MNKKIVSIIMVISLLGVILVSTPLMGYTDSLNNSYNAINASEVFDTSGLSYTPNVTDYNIIGTTSSNDEYNKLDIRNATINKYMGTGIMIHDHEEMYSLVRQAQVMGYNLIYKHVISNSSCVYPTVLNDMRELKEGDMVQIESFLGSIPGSYGNSDLAAGNSLYMKVFITVAVTSILKYILEKKMLCYLTGLFKDYLQV